MVARKLANVVGGRLVPGRLPLIALIALLFAVAIPVALTLDSPGADVAAPQSVQETPDLCENARETCASVEVNARDWRYSLIKSSPATDQTVIVDLGGPGVSALSGTYRLGSYARDLPELSNYNVLVIEEPWVTSDITDVCRQAASNYYRRARAGVDLTASARDLFAMCAIGTGQWGFQPQTYTEVVSAITAKESLNLKGFIGHSFGSARYSYLSQSTVATKLEWAVLARPFPVGVDAATFTSRRAQLTQSMFGNVVDNGRTMPSTDSRSLEITAFDELSALVGLSYVASGDEQEATHAVVRDRNGETIGNFSDNLWHRYGTDSISSAYLAQLDEVCSVMKSNQGLGTVANSHSVSGIIAATLLPCAAAAPTTTEILDKPICVVTSKLDPVVAGDAALAMLNGHKGKVITYDSAQASHNSRDGLQYCLKEMLGSP